MTPLLRELGDLKRIRSAGRAGSIAERLFAEAWSRVLDGGQAWRPIVGAALAAARLGDLDAVTLNAAGLSAAEIGDIRRRAVMAMVDGNPHHHASRGPPPPREERGGGLEHENLCPPSRSGGGVREADGGGRTGLAALIAALAEGLDDIPPTSAPPPFVARLAAQPRAGVTCPGKPRLLFEPPENHAEHCLMVAVYGVLLAPGYGADPARVFLASIAHHLHNALLPDSGFTGEMLLGDALGPAMARATEIALNELSPPARARVVEAREMLPDANTADGRAFHAADTLDRVFQIEQHLRAGRTTMETVLREMRLVHEGPVKPFQDAVLREHGLM